jgi:hypothetical protein
MTELTYAIRDTVDEYRYRQAIGLLESDVFKDAVQRVIDGKQPDGTIWANSYNDFCNWERDGALLDFIVFDDEVDKDDDGGGYDDNWQYLVGTGELIEDRFSAYEFKEAWYLCEDFDRYCSAEEIIEHYRMLCKDEDECDKDEDGDTSLGIKEIITFPAMAWERKLDPRYRYWRERAAKIMTKEEARSLLVGYGRAGHPDWWDEDGSDQVAVTLEPAAPLSYWDDTKQRNIYIDRMDYTGTMLPAVFYVDEAGVTVYAYNLGEWERWEGIARAHYQIFEILEREGIDSGSEESKKYLDDVAFEDYPSIAEGLAERYGYKLDDMKPPSDWFEAYCAEIREARAAVGAEIER